MLHYVSRSSLTNKFDAHNHKYNKMIFYMAILYAVLVVLVNILDTTIATLYDLI